MRKHRDLIIAWANGSDIQCLVGGSWIDIDLPNWHDDAVFRIKPKEKTVFLDIRYDESCDDNWDAYTTYCEGFKSSIKVTFGEDNRPIKVELI
jgi:hypothetical protein